MADQKWVIDSFYDGGGFCNDCDRQEVEFLECDDADKAYHFAAHKAGWRHGGDCGGFWYDGNEFESWKAAASSDDGPTYATAREVCESEGIEV
jgi:hypothetical protein